VVEEVGAAGAAVEVPGDDGVLGGGVHSAAPAPEHALPLQPLQEEQPHPEMHHRHYRPIDRRINWKQQDKLGKGKHRSRFSAPKERRKDKEPFLEEMATEKRWCGKATWEWSVGGSNPNPATAFSRGRVAPARGKHVFMATKV